MDTMNLISKIIGNLGQKNYYIRKIRNFAKNSKVPTIFLKRKFLLVAEKFSKNFQQHQHRNHANHARKKMFVKGCVTVWKLQKFTDLTTLI